MKKMIILLCLVLFYSEAFAEIQAQVEPSKINLGEVFKVSFTITDPQNGGIPDLTPLQKDFTIIGTERTMNYSVINGQAQTLSLWVIALKAKKKGILTIPSIKIGLDHSVSLTINIESGSKIQQVQNQNLPQENTLLKTTVDQSKPYINQEVIYTVRLYNNRRLLDANYQGPQVEDALLIPLGDEKRYQTELNGSNYDVEEQNYAIYPQKSGPLKITAPVFNALIYDINPQRIHVKDKTIQLAVQPIPTQFQAKNWLPAKQVILTEHYEDTTQTLTQGSTLTRTITLEGHGVPAQLLPTLKFESKKEYQVYPEKGGERNRLQQGQLVGTSTIKVTYLFNTAGRVTIPELKLAWFNTQTGTEAFASLAPRSLDIKPSASSTNNTPPSKVLNQVDLTQPEATMSVKVQANDNKPWITALFFAVAWIVTLFLWLWQHRPKKKKPFNKVLKELKQACAAHNSMAARNAVLKWGALHWPDARLLNLTDLMQLVSDASLKNQLKLLSEALYKQGDTHLWQGDELYRAVVKQPTIKSKIRKGAKVLPPINPL